MLGPIGGILIADYFILRGTELDLEQLYKKKGIYSYKGGFNPIAVVAFLIAVAPNLPGFLKAAGAVESVPEVFNTIYTYAWFVGFILAALLYVAGMKALPQVAGAADSGATSS